MSFIRVMVSAVVVIWAGLTFSFAQQQSAASNAKPEDQIKQLERDWLAADAKGDAASLRRIIADDFIGNAPGGQLLNKDDIIPEGGGLGVLPGQHRATPMCGSLATQVFCWVPSILPVDHRSQYA